MAILNVLVVSLCVSCSLATEDVTFSGASDVSAGVFLDDSHFAVTDDETNLLRIYALSDPQKPLAQVDVSAFLEVDGKSPEADIEAAAKVGERIYWITSHGRNKDGKLRLSRYRFFCTRIEPAEAGGVPGLVPEGTVCKNLADQLIEFASPVQDKLRDATQFAAKLNKKDAAKLAPKENGLNIEGLTCYPPNKSLLIGLRNPLYGTKGQSQAIVVELLNPADVIENGAAAQFGKTLLWNLDGRGIRGLEYTTDKYYILAGPVDDETTCAVFEWDGRFENAPTLFVELPAQDTFTPEGIAQAPGGQIWLFSDDGALEITVESPAQCLPKELLPNGTCPNKFLTDPACRTFRIRPLK